MSGHLFQPKYVLKILELACYYLSLKEIILTKPFILQITRSTKVGGLTQQLLPPASGIVPATCEYVNDWIDRTKNMAGWCLKYLIES